MSHLSPGLISAYNSLTDKHLSGYFSNTRIKRHLQRAGLITRSGRIVPDKEYRHKAIQRAHQRHVRECLAQAIFHKVLEMERLHQMEIRRKLEEFARRERVYRMKAERSQRYAGDITHILSPRPPTGSRTTWKQSAPEGEHSESSESPSSSRPNTAPGKMQRPVRLKPIHRNSATASVRRRSPYRTHEVSQETNRLLNSTMDIKFRRRLTPKEVSHGISPYCLPVINNFVTPVPPVVKKTDRGVKVPASSTLRGRRLRPTTASSGSHEPPWLRGSVYQSRVCVNIVYFGKTVHLSNDLIDTRDEVKVFQQHCGGENLCVYKGMLREGEAFQFISRRHRGFPFSLAFYLNGLLVERLSSCCEFKHRKGSRLGGRHGHFGFSSVEGASPCYKCILAMGLDKKPTPPPKRVKGKQSQEEFAISRKDEPQMVTERTGEGADAHLEQESFQTPKMETQITERVESKARDDYEEDFEADDEGPVEEATLQEEKLPSLLSKTENQDHEKDSSEAEDEEDDEDRRSCTGSSLSSSSEEDSDVETTKPSEDEETEDKSKGDKQTETAALESEKDTQNSEETAAIKVQSASVSNSDVLDSAGDSTGIEISDTSVSTRQENKLSDDASEGKNLEDSGHEMKHEDERAKSVQEKLVEAVLKESHCSSEPELSDTSTEEEEVPAEKAPEKENKEQQKIVVGETSCEESVTNQVIEEQKEFTETEKKDKDPGGVDNTQEERVSEVGEDEKTTEDEATTEGDNLEEPDETHLPVDGENAAKDDKIEDPFEESDYAISSSASQADEEKVENCAAEPKSHPDETGQRAKSREEDESSVLELREEADEAVVADIAEAETMTTSVTMEIKAESSEERASLSCEEVPETATEKMQADSEEAQVAAENSSTSPQEECGDSTAEKAADMHVETVKTQSSNEEILLDAKQQPLKMEEAEDDSQQENSGTREDFEAVNETAEQRSLINTEKTEDECKTEETDESKVDESTELKEIPPEGTESEKMPNEENKDGIKEMEKYAEGEGVEDEISSADPDKKRDDNGQTDEEESETKKDLQEKEDELGISESVEKEEAQETKVNKEREDITKNSGAEGAETFKLTEEFEKSQDADLDTEEMKISSGAIIDSEEVSESKAPEGTEMGEPTPDDSEAETGEREAAKESERGEINAENGEISVAAPCESQENEKNDKERETEEPHKESEITVLKEVVVESGDNVEKQDVSFTDQAQDTHISESGQGDGAMVKHVEASNRDSEPEASGAAIQNERNSNEEVEELEKENKEFSLIQNNTGDDVCEVSLLDEISSTQKAASVRETASQEDEGKPEATPDKPLVTGENGEDGEEASKASEEGASVLLNPQAKSMEAEDAGSKEPPEALARDDSTDMVTNWIQMHQMSKCFETFVEPLEDLKKEVPDARVSNPNGEEKEFAEPLRPESSTMMGTMSGDEKGSSDEAQLKALDSRGEEEELENEPEESGPQVSEGTGKKSMEAGKETDENESRESHGEDKDFQEETNVFKSEVEAFSGSLKAEGDFENQSSGNVHSGPDLTVNHAATYLSFKTEQSNLLNGQKDTDNTWDQMSGDRRPVTQITSFTTSSSADGNQEESHDEDIQRKMLERRFSGETREMQLIEDIKHTLSKERLSTFSLFGHTSYPLLTTSRSEGGQ